MKRVAIALTVLAVVAFVATVAFGVLGIWTGDQRFGQTCALGVFVTIIIGGAAPLVWIGVDE